MKTINADTVHIHEKGQGLVEYALILVLVAIVLIALLLVISGHLQQAYCAVITTVQQGKVPGTCVALVGP